MVQQGKLENIMLAIDSSNPLRITVLNQVPKALELLRQDPQVSRLSVDENKIAAGFREAGRRRRICCRNWWMPESLWFHLHGNTTAWSPCSFI